jgi:hypothetical protein
MAELFGEHEENHFMPAVFLSNGTEITIKLSNLTELINRPCNICSLCERYSGAGLSIYRDTTLGMNTDVIDFLITFLETVHNGSKR